MRAWASVGYDGEIFFFFGGPTFSAYGPLLHIWKDKVADGLVEVIIRPVRPLQKKRGGGR